MFNITVDNKPVSIEEGATILDACQKAGIHVPTLCWLKGINEIGSCRICVVEVEGDDALAASCNTPVRDGMVVRTNSPRAVQERRENLRTILEDHRSECTTCERTSTCALQYAAQMLNVGPLDERPSFEFEPWDETFPLQRDNTKCIRCMRCVAECAQIQYCKVWEMSGPADKRGITTTGSVPIDQAGCSLCGQCITHCPTGALTVRRDIDRVIAALADPDVMTVVQFAPAVRSAWGEMVHLKREDATPGLMAAAARELGFDRIFDTDFGADLTIMEEASEFIEYIKSGKKRPMFTSCCPGWVRFAKDHFPEFVPQLSSSKSPHQMLGAVIKNTLKEQMEAEGKKRLFTISIMPCVAKKYECGVPQLATEGGQDIDAVLTTREFCRMISMFNVNVHQLKETDFDNPLGTSTGAGTIFGRTGGVMEAALRTAGYFLTGEKPSFEDCDTTAATPDRPWMDKTIELAGSTFKIAVASGLSNTAKLLHALEDGSASYDFVEIMACPGGCVGGGGQPISFNQELAPKRAAVLNSLDHADTLRYSFENPDIQQLYKNWLGEPLSKTAEAWLHTNQETWDIVPH